MPSEPNPDAESDFTSDAGSSADVMRDYHRDLSNEAAMRSIVLLLGVVVALCFGLYYG